jgi:hypothetical protein
MGSGYMRFQCLLCLVLASLALAQAAQRATSADAINKTAEVTVGSDDPVITINGFCSDPAQQAGTCKTVVTRAQFEKLTEALQPGMSLSVRLKVANAYARNLRMAAAAEKRGLDKTSAFEEEMRFARMQLLAQDLSRELEADANNISEADVEHYYKKNESSYEQATVARIFVPHAKQEATGSTQRKEAGTRTSTAQPSETQTRSAVQAMTKVAADLRTRAVNGEDADKLQLEAYAEAGVPATNTKTKMENVRRAMLPPGHEEIMDLKPGEVSQVFSDPDGAHFIYKMISKKTLTLDDVKSEIRAVIARQRYRDSMKVFESDVVFSDAYFIPSGTPATAHRNRTGNRKPPAQLEENHN